MAASEKKQQFTTLYVCHTRNLNCAKNNLNKSALATLNGLREFQDGGRIKL
jgi:hypothetical protein